MSKRVICSDCGGHISGVPEINTKYCDCVKVQYGWVCPLCNTAYSPYKSSCDCSRKYPSSAQTTIQETRNVELNIPKQ